MGKQGEIDYLRNIGEAGLRHDLQKPFNEQCAKHLLELGVILALLPPPPARLLDLGCGTGWTSCFFARRGYQVVGQDIAEDMIYHATSNKDRHGPTENLQFVTSDYESMAFHDEFDCAVFCNSLHHSVNEEDALRQVYRALRAGGVCLTSEPGVGHARASHSLDMVQRFQVTERDMPPRLICSAARKVGFSSCQVYPHIDRLARNVYHPPPGVFGKLKALCSSFVWITWRKRSGGVVVLWK